MCRLVAAVLAVLAVLTACLCASGSGRLLNLRPLVGKTQSGVMENVPEDVCVCVCNCCAVDCSYFAIIRIPVTVS